MRNGTYRMAAGRIVRYFITRVDLGKTDSKEQARLQAFLNNHLKIIETLALIGDDFLAYGNSLTSIVTPFRRILVCTECNSEMPADTADWEFVNWEFEAHCHKCRRRTRHTRDDRPVRDEARIRVARWSPHDFQILHHFYSQDTEFYWKIPATVRAEIGRGTKFMVQHTPWEIIQACKTDQYFRFNPG